VKILVAADGSKYTTRAVRYVVDKLLPLPKGSAVHLVNVHRPIPAHAASALGKAEVQDYYRDECDKALAPASRLLDKAGIAHEPLRFVGEPGEEIARVANKGAYDMVIMGSHGHGALATLVLGSVASKVLAHSKVPVLIVR
jgi:nucleotide-binding universal stress UspA family protein